MRTRGILDRGDLPLRLTLRVSSGRRTLTVCASSRVHGDPFQEDVALRGCRAYRSLPLRGPLDRAEWKSVTLHRMRLVWRFERLDLIVGKLNVQRFDCCFEM